MILLKYLKELFIFEPQRKGTINITLNVAYICVNFDKSLGFTQQ